jgi:cobalt-zinc-cadmium efflux system membrane fusion protein
MRFAMLRRHTLLPIVLALASCGQESTTQNDTEAEAKPASGLITLTPEQIKTAGIEVVSPSIGGSGGAISVPGLIGSDPDATRVVAAPIEGRIIALPRNLGDPIRRGDTLAVIESREAAGLQADVEKAQTRLNLARATLNRDEALFKRGFRPLREVEISRAAFDDAQTSLRLARQQVAASGVRGGSLNRIVITAPIAGRVIARTAVLGQVFTTNATETELFRIADVGRLSVTLSLSAADAARVKPGNLFDLSAGDRRASGRVVFVSPALDPQTRLVPVIAKLDNRAGLWRVGEPVSISIRLPGGSDGTLRIPTTAVQTIDGKTVVFVRIATGFRAAPVTLGAQDGDMVVVKSGLTGSDRIAAANSFTVKSTLGAVGDED